MSDEPTVSLVSPSTAGHGRPMSQALHSQCCRCAAAFASSSTPRLSIGPISYILFTSLPPSLPSF